MGMVVLVIILWLDVAVLVNSVRRVRRLLSLGGELECDLESRRARGHSLR
jgi:hypothetical protein